MNTRATLLSRLDKAVSRLYEVCADITDPGLHVGEDWTVKDVISHLTFWHESFARNVRDLAHDMKPVVLKGTLADLNQRSVDEMRDCTLKEILGRFRAAHAVIQKHILNPRLTTIPYRKGSRDYTPEEHLEIVEQHIAEHMKRVSKAVNATR